METSAILGTTHRTMMMKQKDPRFGRYSFVADFCIIQSIFSSSYSSAAAACYYRCVLVWHTCYCCSCCCCSKTDTIFQTKTEAATDGVGVVINVLVPGQVIFTNDDDMMWFHSTTSHHAFDSVLFYMFFFPLFRLLWLLMFLYLYDIVIAAMLFVMRRWLPTDETWKWSTTHTQKKCKMFRFRVTFWSH